VRFVVRVSILTLVGFIVAFGVIAIFKAQAKLDQLVELYLKSSKSPLVPPQLATASARPVAAPTEARSGPATLLPTVDEAGPSADTPAPTGTELRDTVGGGQIAPLAAPEAGEPPDTNKIAARQPQTTPEPAPVEAAKAIASRVNNAQGVVDFALPDRSAPAAPPNGESAEPDDARFSSVRVHRLGAGPSVHRVPKETPNVPRQE